MSFKAKSLLVWLFATLVTTVVLVPQQVAAASSTYSEEAACEADATCNECYSIGETFNQAFEECYATLDDPYSCDRFMLTACCQHKVSESDCLLNDPFLAVWWTYMSAYSCINVFPSVEGCESIGVVVTSGGSTGLLDTPAPSAAGKAVSEYYEVCRIEKIRPRYLRAKLHVYGAMCREYHYVGADVFGDKTLGGVGGEQNNPSSPRWSRVFSRRKPPARILTGE